MLKDSEIVQLQSSERYHKITKLGLKKFVADLVKSGQGDLKPEVTVLFKIIYSLSKTRLIRQELYICSKEFIERILNLDLNPYNRSIKMVKDTCDNESNMYIWMRFDIQRVKSLFGRCMNLMSEANFRDVVKSYSTIRINRNERLIKIMEEMELLLKFTLRSISTKGLFDDLVKFNAEEYYQLNEQEIQRKFLDAGERGFLGMLPQSDGDSDDQL